MLRKLLIGLLLLGGLGYGAALVALVLTQRKMMYFPSPSRGDAADWGLERALTLALKTPDKQTIVAWYQPPLRDDRPLFLYFHGNGGDLSDRAKFLAALSDDGSGFLAIDYRGYGGSTGSPTETGLVLDGATAYAQARSLGYAPARIVVVGESLGSGVAVAVAAKHEEHALILDSAFSSAADVAARDYPMFPVHMLMKDPFESFREIAAVTVPKLFLYGDKDSVIPRASALKLYDAATQPKTLIEFPDLGHVVLLDPSVLARAKAWLAALPPGLEPEKAAKTER